MVRFVVKRNAPTIYDYLSVTKNLLWTVVDAKENKEIGKYKTKNLAESACFNFNTYGPEAEQFFKDGIVDRNKINKPDHREDDPLPKPKRHSNKRLISLD